MAGTRTVQFIVAADASQFQRVVGQVESAGGRLVTSQQAMSTEVQKTTGHLEHSGAAGREAFLVIGQAMSATGAQFGPLTTAFYRLDMIFDALDGRASKVSRTFAGIGVAGMVAGGLITATASKEQSATASLQNAVEDAGKSWDQYKNSLENAAAAQAHFGTTKAQAEDALSTLVTASKDPAQAIKDLSLSQDLAAKTGVSLSDAAGQIARVYGGSTKVLQQFGENAKDLVNPEKELTKAHQDQTAAAQALTDAQQHLSDVEQRVAAAKQAAQDAYTAKVQSATEAEQSADQRVEDSTRSLSEAKQHLRDVQEQIHESTQLTISDQYALIHAQDSLQDVQARIASGALTGQDAYEALRNAQENLAETNAQQAEKTKPSLSQMHQLRDAHQSVAKASENLTRAHEKQTAAHENLQKIRAAGPAGIPLGLQQEEAAAERSFHKAQARVAVANAEMKKARADMAAFPSRVQHVLDDVNSHVHGAAEAQAHTLEGTYHRWIAKVENWLGGLGTNTGMAITAVSSGVTAVSAIASSGVGKMIGNALRKIGLLKPAMIASDAEVAAAGAATDATLVAESAAAGEASTLALGPIGLALAVIGIAAYELYKHWHAVWNAIKKVVDVVWGFLKKHFLDIILFLTGGLGVYELYKNWHKVWGLIRRVVSDVWGEVKKLTTDFINWMIDAFNGMVKILLTPVNVMIDAINAVIGMIDAIHFTIPSWVPIFGGDKFGINIPKLPHVSFSVDHIGASKPKSLPAGVGGGSAATTGGHTLAYAEGGTVPGPIGMPQWAIVHGGEHISSVADVMSGRSGGAAGPPARVTLEIHLHAPVDASTGKLIGEIAHNHLLRKQRRGTPLGFKS